MFDPNEQSTRCEAYLRRALDRRVDLVRAAMLSKSTREAPWRLLVSDDGAERSYVLRLGLTDAGYEYDVLKAMEPAPIPTPGAYGLDLRGETLGTPCFISDFIDGDSLLGPLQAGEPWAEDLYVGTVCALQSLTTDDLGGVADTLRREPADAVLDAAYAAIEGDAPPLAGEAYAALKETMPTLPSLRFSNGDLWPDNFIVEDRRLAGVIDFENAAFSDPVYEFLLAFFVAPDLSGRGIEERYCERMGHDPASLRWYRGLEYFDTWSWAVRTGRSFVHHTAASLELDLTRWLAEGRHGG